MPPSSVAVGLGVGIIGIVLTVIFFRRSQRLKKPSWAIRTTSLIKGFKSNLEGLAINFKGQPVGSVAVSRVVFWNDGADTINRGDVVSVDPLRLVPKGGSAILDAGILASNYQSNEFSVSPAGDGSTHMNFGYIDKGQGIVLQVVHTGASSNDIAIVGTIKGAKVERRDPALSLRPQREPWMFATTRGTIKFLASVLIFAFLFWSVLILLKYVSTKYQVSYPGFFLPTMAAALVLMFIWYTYRVDRLPKGLEAFLQDPYESDT